MTQPGSPVLQALYRHAIEEARGLALGRSLDLFEAAALGDLTALARFEASAADLDAAGRDGFTALHLACYFGHPETAHWLLARGADPAAPGPGGLQPLHSALACPDEGAALAVARLLLERGAPVDATQAGGYAPLHAAAQRGSLALAALLVDRGADCRRPTQAGETPAELASRHHHEELQAWLRMKG